jgi:hypothetical protein
MGSGRVEAEDEAREPALSALTPNTMSCPEASNLRPSTRPSVSAPMIATLMTRGYGAASALENTESV